MNVPDDLQRRLQQHRQSHVLNGWDGLDSKAQAAFLRQLQSVDLDELARLHAQRHQKDALPDLKRLARLPEPEESAAERERYRHIAEQAFRAGEVAFLVVAGGQGTRLGFDHPKGMYPVGPVSGKSLFQLHAEKIIALGRRYGKPLRLLVMTSSATHDETVAYFASNSPRWQFPLEQIDFFCQGSMPALDFDSGRLLLEAPGKLALSPNGHGGVLAALRDHDLFSRLEIQGIRTIFYFQVDNPLTNLADLLFVGRHLAQRAEVSSKVLPKKHPQEKMGNFVLIDGRCSIIEYSDLPQDWAHRRDDRGRLFFWGGNTAIHLFDVEFLRRVSAHSDSIPWHLARKKVAYLDAKGNFVQPDKENALKFERFIFDVLPLAERWTVAATTRAADFEPIKNAKGDDSPETVRRALIEQAASWLEQAGVMVPRNERGEPRYALEISPLLALDEEELRRCLPATFNANSDIYLDSSS